jgi:hypothetical protein
MQIDFHHAVTYTVARISGFDHKSADIIAYAAQYVDDSSTSGFLRFNNGVRYQRQATAHPMLDAENLDNDDNSLSWLPFHFLPGNNLLDAGSVTDTDYFGKLVCRPDSHIAKAMMASAIRAKERPQGLHRLGMAAHVFVDTFAHQGFIGQRHNHNKASNIRDSENKELSALPVPPIGHGLVGTYPDQPYLKWSYEDSNGERISRDNPHNFTLAADRLCQEFRRYILGKPDADVQGLGDVRNKITDMFVSITYLDGEVRHGKWLDALAGDHFGFGAIQLSYQGKGEGSWKGLALGDTYLRWHQDALDAAGKIVEDKSFFGRVGAQIHNLAHRAEALADKIGVEQPVYSSAEIFLSSNYKLFHDAARDQRYDVFGEILPRFGIFAA